MRETDAYALPRSELNAFLFADIGVEASGMTLSVISALARLGMDPWAEAGRLADLPRAAAVDGLARLIATLPAGSWPMPEAVAIASRLIALLPRSGAIPVIVPRNMIDAAVARRVVAQIKGRATILIVAGLVLAVLVGLFAGLPAAPAAPEPLPRSSPAGLPQPGLPAPGPPASD